MSRRYTNCYKKVKRVKNDPSVSTIHGKNEKVYISHFNKLAKRLKADSHILGLSEIVAKLTKSKTNFIIFNMEFSSLVVRFKPEIIPIFT